MSLHLSQSLPDHGWFYFYHNISLISQLIPRLSQSHSWYFAQTAAPCPSHKAKQKQLADLDGDQPSSVPTHDIYRCLLTPCGAIRRAASQTRCLGSRMTCVAVPSTSSVSALAEVSDVYWRPTPWECWESAPVCLSPWSLEKGREQ